MAVSTKKTIHFIRHGESVCNVLRRKHAGAFAVPDPSLSYEGMQQANRLKEYLGKTIKPEVAISSPYTRALLTCLLSYSSDNVVVTPLCGEFVTSCDDIGTPASLLQELFPMYDFSSLDEIWYYLPEGVDTQRQAVGLFAQGNLEFETCKHIAKRLENFYDFLMKRHEHNIAVFAHNDFLCEFLSKYFEFDDDYLDNCEVFTATI